MSTRCIKWVQTSLSLPHGNQSAWLHAAHVWCSVSLCPGLSPTDRVLDSMSYMGTGQRDRYKFYEWLWCLSGWRDFGSPVLNLSCKTESPQLVAGWSPHQARVSAHESSCGLLVHGVPQGVPVHSQCLDSLAYCKCSLKCLVMLFDIFKRKNITQIRSTKK